MYLPNSVKRSSHNRQEYIVLGYVEANIKFFLIFVVLPRILNGQEEEKGQGAGSKGENWVGV
jgi:hypothetical protein